MARTRQWFHLATIRSEGQEKVLALGGETRGSKELNTVEEWVEESSTWKPVGYLVESRAFFGAAVVPKKLICPV